MDDHRQQVQSRFGEFAQNYVESKVHSSSYSLDHLIELLDPQPGQIALDIATGGGHVALGLARRGLSVIASDLTPRMLGAARAYIQKEGFAIHYAQIEGSALPFAANSLDRVTCRIAAHHFPDVAGFVRECARVVRPGGMVGLVDQVGPGHREANRYVNAYEKLRDPSHNWEYSEQDWNDFFTSADLTIRHQETARNRLNFKWWTDMQKVDPDTVLRLRVMLRQAPREVAAWLEPDLHDSPDDSFSLWQLILIGVK
ncbi:MAG TPA: class I SAM-dependent methyltransferase [Aggregatilineales bacterium]|nr:class I SAM-dependent methyltransferase [Aggregatilineales bacterium]